MKPEVTLKVFGVPQPTLREYHITPNKRSGIEHHPTDQFRLPEEEIQGTIDIERESQKKVPTKSQTSTSASSTKGKEESKGGSVDSDGSHESFDFVAP